MEAWSQPDKRIYRDVGHWFRTMRQWGPPRPPDIAPYKPGHGKIFVATHSPTDTIAVLRIERFESDHLFAGQITVLRIIEP